MADVKISALPAVVTAATTDIFAIVQGGVTYKATLTQVVTAITSTGLTATAGALTVNLSTGVAGGQSVIGGTTASNNLTLSSTTNATKGKILFGTSAYDEVNNSLGIGTVSPSSMLHNVSTASSVGGTDSPDNILIDRYTGASASSAAFPMSVLRRARGTEASPSAVLNGDNLGIFGWRSYNGSAFTGTRASLVVFASENWTTTANGTEFAFFTTPIGTTSITERLRIFNTGNVLIQNGGTFTDSGFRLDVNGTARVQGQLTGTGNLSITNGVGGNEILNFSTTSAIMRFGTQNNFVRLAGGLTTRGLAISSDIAGVVNTTVLAISSNSTSTNPTSGTSSITTFDVNFNPTSGTAQLHTLGVVPTINQTGGANGITRGLYINPTLTAAADWRSIETSNNTGYAAYFAGTADLFFNDATDLQFGTTTGTKIGTATTQKLGFWNAAPIAQPTTAVAAATLVGGGGTTLTDTDTFDGYTLKQVVKALRNAGLLA